MAVSLSEVRVPRRIVAHFARQIATLLVAGVPLLRALETLTDQEDYPEFGLVVDSIVRSISSGQRLSRALREHPNLFDKVFVTTIQVGEETGKLVYALTLLGDWLTREDRVRRRMAAAATYPCLVLGVTALLTFLLFVLVLPGLVQIFEDLKVPLPILTRIVVLTSKICCNPGFWVLASLGLFAGWRLWTSAWRNPAQAYALYSVLLRVPALGAVLKHGSLARFADAFFALLSCGADLSRSLRLASTASGSPVLERDAARVIREVQEGTTVSDAMQEEASRYSSTLLQMIRTGEETSRLPELLRRAALFHDSEVDYAAEMLTASLEPLMLLIVSLLVGGIVISIFLPMYGVMANLG